METLTASPTLEPLTLTRSKRGSKQKRAAQAALTAASRPRRLDAELLAAADDAVELPTAAEAVRAPPTRHHTAAGVWKSGARAEQAHGLCTDRKTPVRITRTG